MKYDEKKEDKKIQKQIDKITKDSLVKINKIEQEIEKTINNAHTNENSTLDNLIKENNKNIERKYENLRIEAKY